MSKFILFVLVYLLETPSIFAQNNSLNSLDTNNLTTLQKLFPNAHLTHIQKVISTEFYAHKMCDAWQNFSMATAWQLYSDTTSRFWRQNGYLLFVCEMRDGTTIELIQQASPKRAKTKPSDLQDIEKYFPPSSPVWKEFVAQDIAYIEVIANYQPDGGAKIRPDKWTFKLTHQIDRLALSAAQSQYNRTYTINLFMYRTGIRQPVKAATKTLTKL